jgi:hypothetical protein
MCCCYALGANEVGSAFLAGEDDQEPRGLVTQIAAVVPRVGHLGETLAGLESVSTMALHLDGERAIKHVDEERNWMHVASDLATRRHLGEHSDQLILTLGKSDWLAGERCRRLKNGCELQPDGSMLLRLCVQGNSPKQRKRRDKEKAR